MQPESVVLREWQSKRVPGVRLSAEDRRLLKGLAAEDSRRLVVDELLDGVRITSTSWVGVVRLNAIEIRITPKLAGDALNLARMLDIALGLDALNRSEGIRSIAADGASLFDLLAGLLADEAGNLVRAGLITDYVEREDDLSVVHGRLLWDRQILQRYGQVDRLECRFDDRTHDIPENQVIAAALEACLRRTHQPAVKASVHRQYAVVASAASVPADPLQLRPCMAYNRLNSQYQDAHALSWLILENLNMDDLLKSGNVRSFTFLIDMNAVFEKFIYEVVRWSLAGTEHRIKYQDATSSVLWDRDRRKTFGRLKPDVVVYDSDKERKRFPIDAKYKLYDGKKVSPGDFYQLLTYGLGYSRSGEVGRSALIYPANTDNMRWQRLQLRRDGEVASEVTVIGIFIPRMLDEMEEQEKDGRTAYAMRDLVLTAFGFGGGQGK